MKSNRRVKAFTVFEITVVMALTSLLTAMFFNALNRFNSTVAQETKIKNELNQFYLVRSNLWRELDECDSIQLVNNELHVYNQLSATQYSIENERLVRKKGENKITFETEFNEFGIKTIGKNEYAFFSFNWKEKELVMRYPLKRDLCDQINTYFELESWK